MLQLAPGCIGLIALDCRSWGTPSRGTSWRTIINVLGLNGRDFVHCANLMASRKLGVHAACMNSSMFQYQSRIHARMHVLTKGLFDMLTYPQPTRDFVVEQPRQSLLYSHYRWQWLQERVCWVTLLCQMAHMHI